jgi:2-polyprenyl-3-methyl-5-hydroxy-6-metoxy-1,4-benzoquinol methylase
MNQTTQEAPPLRHLAKHEREKYEKAWAIPEYHTFSPAMNIMPLFKAMVKKPKRPTGKGKPAQKLENYALPTLLDIGAGTGRASEHLAEAGWSVTMLDHVRVNKDCELPFIKANIFGNWPSNKIGVRKIASPGQWSYPFDQGFCCDVMEHIPPEQVDAALNNIATRCQRMFFSINFHKDHFGTQVGHPLHLTVQPFMWWVKKLEEFGSVKAARDLMGEGVFDVTSD